MSNDQPLPSAGGDRRRQSIQRYAPTQRTVYAEFNRRHGIVGHLFQGRYKAIVVQKENQKENYLLELTRYVLLNPIRAGRVRRLEDWPWSNYRAVAGLDESPQWLDTDWLLSQFAKRLKRCRQRYAPSKKSDN